MIATTLNIPLTGFERMELGEELAYFPATWEEFLDVWELAEYKIEYQDGNIIAMGYETNPHGKIITEFIKYMGLFFGGLEFSTFSENRPVFSPNYRRRIYCPDVFVIDEPSILFEYRKGMNAETTPFFIVEVLSKSTQSHDWNMKLPTYQSIPTVEQILYLDSRFPAAVLFTRAPGTESGWEEKTFDKPEDEIEIRGNKLSLRQIYRKTRYFD
ncbi:MAG: Uma2 family endonuclease [Bacteroidota bacterium]